MLKASCRINIPTVGGGGILASIFAKNVISPEYEIAGMFVGLLPAYAFVVNVNMKDKASAIKAHQV
jgi:hypothetical protein